MIIANCIADFTISYGLPFSLFLAGLVGGVTHCSGMCAPFVLAQVKDGIEFQRMGRNLLLPYHFGRMISYVGMAVLLSSVLNLAYLFSDIRSFVAAPLLFLAGILFLVNAFPALGQVFPWAIHFQSSASVAWISRYTSGLMMSANVFKKFFLGVLLGFMPCGMVVSALMATATASSPLMAGLSMAAFALGTMPILMIVGLGAGAIRQKYPKFSRRFSQGAMAISALWLFTLAGMMVF